MRRRWSIAAGALLVLCAMVFIKAPYFGKDRALLVVRIYDRYQEEQSVAKNLGMDIHLHLEDTDLFPLLVTYNDKNLSRYLGKPLHFTVDYTFGDFQKGKGYSRIYDDTDPLYNAYLGYYSITGFERKITEEDLMLISEYDMLHLALPAVGLPVEEAAFEILAHEKQKDVIISSFTFTSYESSLVTNGPEHQGVALAAGDFLFGTSPPSPVNYPLHEMKGRVYLHYFKDLDLNLVFYTLAKSDALLHDFEENILKKTEINFQ